MTEFLHPAKSADGDGPEGRRHGRRTRINQFDDRQAEGSPSEADAPDPIDPDLRARYLDYCAARISEVFLSLSDERTYALMEEAARDADIEIGSLGFSEMMDLVTERLRQSVPLPSFADFAREYAEHPERFEAMLLEPPDAEADEAADAPRDADEPDAG